MPDNPKSDNKKGRSRPSVLRSGFSTGTAAAAAVRAALRHLVTGTPAKVIAVRLPSGVYLPVPVAWTKIQGRTASASVIKDGGDDPDITNGAEIRATISLLHSGASKPAILLSAGKGVGLVTKPGLPAATGEPAINPVPRQMLSDNIAIEIRRLKSLSPDLNWSDLAVTDDGSLHSGKPVLQLPLYAAMEFEGTCTHPNNFSVKVEIEVPRGEELSRHTLNPRLGIIGGISILGTTGIVRPFSNEAYEQTIQAALSVAVSNGCHTAVLSTGGKSERFARQLLPELPAEAFIQIADFFAFSLQQSRLSGISRIIHSVFFGKALKMAQGYPNTHAHTVPLNLDFLAAIARSLNYDADHCRQLNSANTARHALEFIAGKGSYDIIESVARRAAVQSAQLAGEGAGIRLLLFDYNGSLLADIK